MINFLKELGLSILYGPVFVWGVLTILGAYKHFIDKLVQK